MLKREREKRKERERGKCNRKRQKDTIGLEKKEQRADSVREIEREENKAYMWQAEKFRRTGEGVAANHFNSDI